MRHGLHHSVHIHHSLVLQNATKLDVQMLQNWMIRNSNTSFSKGPSLFRLTSWIPCFKIFSLSSELHFKIQVNYISIVLMVQNTLQHLLRFWSPGDNQYYNFEFIKFQSNAHRFDIWVSMWNLKIGKCFISLRAYDILKITRAPRCYLDVSSL